MPLRFHDLAPAPADFRAEVLAGLAQDPKAIPPKFFYDRRGSELFEAITRLPEYYPTRTEIGIIEHHGREMAEVIGSHGLLYEFGSGSDRKIRALLAHLQPRVYAPIDISGEHLRSAVDALAADHPGLTIEAICADYTVDWPIPFAAEGMSRAAFYPGSSIGNFEPVTARALLRRMARFLGPGGVLLVGVDLPKDATLLEAAYDDRAGVTAAFNRNLLSRMNRELGADFEPARFGHRAFYNEPESRVEMHLVSLAGQVVSVAGRRFPFEAGESIHTENAYKHSVERFAHLALEAGFEPITVWRDPDNLFSVHALRAGGGVAADVLE